MLLIDYGQDVAAKGKKVERMSDLILEVNVENGLPGTAWIFGQDRQDPRYLLAVVYKLREYQEDDSAYRSTPVWAEDLEKFVATWQNGYVQLAIPVIDGDYKVFVFVLAQVLESIAKIKIELQWGDEFFKRLLVKNKSKVARPSIGGQMVL